MKIAVIDGMGGGLGAQIIESIKKRFNKSVEVYALGINSGATLNMIRAGADKGATGENALRVTLKEVDLILGPIGISIPNSMLGEVTLNIAGIISECNAKKILLCVNQKHIELVEVEKHSVSELIGILTDKVESYIQSQK